MRSEETRKQIQELGEQLIEPIALYKRALSNSDDMDSEWGKLLPLKGTLEQIVILADLNTNQITEE